MEDREKSREQLICELGELRERVEALENLGGRLRKAQDAVRQSERLHRSAMEAAGAVPYYRNETSARYVFIGDGIADLIGYEPSEVTHDLFRGLCQRVIPSGTMKGLTAREASERFHRDTESTWGAEVELRTRDGQKRWLLDSAKGLYAATGRLTAACGMLQDITERKRGEVMLTAERNLAIGLGRSDSLQQTLDLCLAAAIEISGMDSGGVYLLNARTHCLELVCQIGLPERYVAAAAGFSQDSEQARLVLRGVPLYASHRDMGVDVDSARLSEGLRAVALLPILHGGKVIGCLNVASHALDEVPVASRSHLEQIVPHIGAAVSRAQSEAALKESEALFRTLFEQAAVGVAQVTPDGRFAKVNERFCEITGYSGDELAGMDFRAITHPDDVRLDEEQIARVSAGGTDFFEIEKRYVHKEGRPLWIRLYSNVARDESGDVQYAIACVADITEQKRMEEDLRRSHNLESLGHLAGGIAHDFNNMLTGVTGNLSLLARMLAEGSEEREIAEDAHEAAVRTKGLTQQLMTFAGGGAPVRESASVEDLIRRTTELTLRGSNTKATYTFEEGLSRAHVDVGQMGQVIQNLVMNADQAMPNGGVLRIGGETEEVGEESQLPLSPGRYVKATVSDEGVGIPEGVLSQVFDPYFTTKTSGHGLGLSICHSIVERHGGHIGVASEVGKGTTFTLYVPASSGDAAADRSARPEAMVRGGGGRVLVMGDEASVRRTLGRMLVELGYEVGYAQDGDEALAAYREGQAGGIPYDLVIMDLTIPGGMGGKEAMAKLRQEDPQVCAIVASGYSNDPVMSDPGSYGFTGRISKPIDIDELAGAAHRALRDRDANRERRGTS